mmetsp:Transcript_26389/g.44560  ORF Transcript_26389/g.44560 Transcript_26389/m.44560 type:complete len:253 (-) Transcript_26389:216-974(-)
MLPFSSSQRSSGGGDYNFPDFVRRMCDFRQMDFESAFDQIFNLLSFEPQRVYTSFYHRKQTKNQWARDDPAFVVIQLCFLMCSSCAFVVAFEDPTFWGYVWAIVYSLVIDWFLGALIVASTCTYLANKYLRQRHSHSVEQEVEWMYAFDVHINSYMCSFVLTHVLQYFLLPVLLSPRMLSSLLANALYGASIIWYAYITHLGYRALPFLGNTQVFVWYPIIVVCVALVLSSVLLLLGMHVNVTRIVMAFHYG